MFGSRWLQNLTVYNFGSILDLEQSVVCRLQIYHQPRDGPCPFTIDKLSHLSHPNVKLGGKFLRSLFRCVFSPSEMYNASSLMCVLHLSWTLGWQCLLHARGEVVSHLTSLSLERGQGCLRTYTLFTPASFRNQSPYSSRHWG